MKKRLTIAIVGAALAATLTFVAASSVKREPVTGADALPAYEIVTTLRSMGLRPTGEPLRRGPYYVLPATDPRGTEVRVVADAQLGDILSVAPMRALNAPNYQRGPRIIHVPQAGERTNNRASVNNRDEPTATHDDDDAEAAPPPRHRTTPQPPRVTPRWQPRADAPPPPPPAPRRAVLSAPPLPAEGPTPIRPTPRFGAKADPADKFAPARDVTPSVPPPPRGYTPPSALPQAD